MQKLQLANEKFNCLFGYNISWQVTFELPRRFPGERWGNTGDGEGAIWDVPADIGYSNRTSQNASPSPIPNLFFPQRKPFHASSSETGIPPQDGQWGGIANGTWNGLVAELINHETDMVLTSLKINSGVNSILEILLRCSSLLWKIWKNIQLADMVYWCNWWWGG